MRLNRDGSISHQINGKEVREHRLVFEQHYNCCLLSRTAIRHKNGINWDNRIENLEVWTKRARSAQLGKWSEPIPEDRHCMRCGSFETKIEVDGREHWLRGHGDYEGGYLCSSCYGHEYQKNIASAHRRVYEQYHQVCILSWGQIHFINGNKNDMRLENMLLLRRGGSALLKIPRISPDRRCMNCDSPSGHGDWSKKTGGYICNSCRTEELRSDRKRVSEFEDEGRIIQMQQKMLDPNFKVGPRQCAKCGSSTTQKRSVKKGGGPDWYRYGDKLDGLWQCRRCYNKENKRPPKISGLVMAWRKALQEVALDLDLENYGTGEGLRRDKKNALRRAKRRALNPSMHRYVAPLQAPKRCAECGSLTTSKNLNRADNWNRLEVPIGPVGYLDNNCYRKRQRRIKRQRAVVRELPYS